MTRPRRPPAGPFRRFSDKLSDAARGPVESTGTWVLIEVRSISLSPGSRHVPAQRPNRFDRRGRPHRSGEDRSRPTRSGRRDATRPSASTTEGSYSLPNLAGSGIPVGWRSAPKPEEPRPPFRDPEGVNSRSTALRGSRARSRSLRSSPLSGSRLTPSARPVRSPSERSPSSSRSLSAGLAYLGKRASFGSCSSRGLRSECSRSSREPVTASRTSRTRPRTSSRSFGRTKTHTWCPWSSTT